MGEGLSQCIQTVLQCSERLLSKGHPQSFPFHTHPTGVWHFRTQRGILSERSPFPFRYGLRMEAVAPSETGSALLRVLDGATNSLGRSDAAVKYLCHSCSSQRGLSTLPLHSGTQHLV